ncbi:MAG TPA: GIY-YIG nuclease family protein [Bacteroidia bacterium]|nr:GIY-YIG nuclease family protein [Bacteroidia bacterium]
MKNMYVYILLCSDKSYYTGVTNNLEHRLLQHHKGTDKGCYTFERRPLELMYYRIFDGPLVQLPLKKN